jgi:uncharacterized protein (DUF362 family)
MSVDLEEVFATITDDADASPFELLARCLDRAGFWALLAARCQDLSEDPDSLRIVIKPDLQAFKPGSPVATDPALVEAFIETLHERGYTNVGLVASADSSSLWAENRDVLATADLLGYRFATPSGRAYDILDLRDDLIPVDLPAGALLHGSSISKPWMDAHVRILFSKNKTDELEGYALSLDSLVGVLPLVDKDYYYRQRFDPGIVALEILRVAPPHFTVIDAVVSSHGSGGSRDPVPLATGTVLASRSSVLADFAAALKMGVDPCVSRLTAAVLERGGLPPRYRLNGNLGIYPGWRAAHPVALDAVRKRDAWVGISRTLKPWLQQLDPTTFPLKEPVDAKANEILSGRFADIDEDAGAFAMYVLGNYGIGWVYELLESYRILNAKDGVRRRHVPLGIDPEAFDRAEYERPLEELLQMRALLRDQPVEMNGLRWRYINEAVVFEIERSFPVAFDEFVSAIDVSKTIQYMNDYLGGVVVPVRLDERNRATHQAERNLYLPQPNYLVLTGGDVIDVTKLEYVQYSDDRHRMSWKTIKSENASATYDDGIVTFTRAGDGTHVSICGRQLFALPQFWQIVNIDLIPSLKTQLVTHAYTTFFQRTFSNLEALIEGRDIRVGRAWHDADKAPGTEPLLAETMTKQITALVEKHGPLFTQALKSRTGAVSVEVDELGFAHFRPGARVGSPASSTQQRAADDSWASGWATFWTELGKAALRDVELQMARQKAPG